MTDSCGPDELPREIDRALLEKSGALPQNRQRRISMQMAGQALTLGIRPEHIRSGAPAQPNTLPALVASNAWCRSGSMPTSAGPRGGEPVQLMLPPSRLLAFAADARTSSRVPASGESAMPAGH